jgi:sulfoquinovosyltransferase
MWWAVAILALSSGIMYLYQLFGNPINYSPSERSKLILKDSKIPLKILLVVEPTPFGYTSGYSNRFKEMLSNIRDCGDEVYIITPDDSSNPPSEYLGFPITTVGGYRLVFYDHVMLSIDLDGQIEKAIKEFEPDVIHVSTPGTLLFPAVYYARKHW